MKKIEFKELKKKINFDIFPYALFVVVTNDVLRSRETRCHILGDCTPNVRFAAALHSQTGAGTSFIFVRPDSRPGVWAHEARHCVWSLMEFIGADHNNELEAYLITYIVDSIEKAVLKWKLDKKS